MERKENTGTTELIRAHAAEILATKTLLEAHKFDPAQTPEARLSVEATIVGNFAYLTAHGRLTPDEYSKLFNTCEAAGDFAPLAQMTREFIIARAESMLADPNLPERGDALNPGKGNLRSALSFTRGEIKGIQNRVASGKPIAVHAIGGPAIREIPDWLLAIEQERIPMSEVYKMLETNEAPTTTVVNKNAENTEHAALGVLDEK